MKSKSSPWRHFVDEEESIVWVVVHSAITAMGACKMMKQKHPGYECHYCSDAFLDKKEQGLIQVQVDKQKKKKLLMSSKAQNAKNETSRLRSLRSATNLQEFDNSQATNQDRVQQNLPSLFGKGLLHLNDGTMYTDPVDQYQLLVALEAGDQNALNQINLGGNRRLVNSQASFCRELVGGVPYGFSMEVPPVMDSAAAACELIEVYEMGLCVDIPFTELNNPGASNVDADRAVTAINAWGGEYKGPVNVSNQVDRQLLFRGKAYGCNFGPHVSQFFMHDFNLGLNPIVQKYYFETGTYGITDNTFLEMQKGNTLETQTQSPTPMRPYTGRGLASLVHVDFVYQFFYYAAQMILTAGIPRHGGYVDMYPDEAFVTNAGVVHIATALADVAKHAFTACWNQKWRRHLRARPEVMAARVVKQKEGVISGVVDNNIFTLGANTIAAVEAYNAPKGGESKAYIPLTYCEGSPTHPAYPSGHAVAAGAMATILKMIFADEDWTEMGDFNQINESPDGDQLTEYTGPDTAAITVHTELNKLASNCSLGRNFAGIHYRIDGDEGMNLGEKVAIQYYEDYLTRQIEPHGLISFKKFDGTTHVIQAGGGQDGRGVTANPVGTRARFARDI